MELRLQILPITMETLIAIVLEPHLMGHFVQSACASIMAHVQRNQPPHLNLILTMDVNAHSSDLAIYASNVIPSMILKTKPVTQHVKQIILGTNVIMFAFQTWAITITIQFVI